MSEHSKAPWTIGETPHYFQVRDANSQPIVRVERPFTTNKKADAEFKAANGDSIARANAELLASAPALKARVEALESALRELYSASDCAEFKHAEDSSAMVGARQTARAALEARQ